MKLWLAASVLACAACTAVAQTAPAGDTTAPRPPSSVTTSVGPGLLSGASGSPQSVMIPGSPVPGLLLNNGNGTSSIMIPGAPSQLVPTPR